MAKNPLQVTTNQLADAAAVVAAGAAAVASTAATTQCGATGGKQPTAVAVRALYAAAARVSTEISSDLSDLSKVLLDASKSYTATDANTAENVGNSDVRNV